MWKVGIKFSLKLRQVLNKYEVTITFATKRNFYVLLIIYFSKRKRRLWMKFVSLQILSASVKREKFVVNLLKRKFFLISVLSSNSVIILWIWDQFKEKTLSKITLLSKLFPINNKILRRNTTYINYLPFFQCSSQGSWKY